MRDDGAEGKVGIERNEERVGDGARKKVGDRECIEEKKDLRRKLKE